MTKKKVEGESKFANSELLSLPAVTDESILERLDSIGIHTYEALAVCPEKDLTDKQDAGGAGLTEDKADKLVTQAQDKCGLKPSVIQAKDIGQYEYISTGSEALDKVLGGGYMIHESTELGGLYGLGKTNMCMTAAVMAWKQYKAPTIYIHTEIHQPFKKERLTQIARARGIDDYDVESQLYYSKPMRSAEQSWVVRNADSFVKSVGAKLLVLDSIGAHLRYEYPGQKNLARRQQILGQQLRQMSRLAQVFNMATILTNQVHADPTGSSQVLTMGNIMQTNVGKILQVFNAASSGKRSMYTKGVGDEGYREVRIMKAVDIDMTGVLCRITERGLDDAVAKKGKENEDTPDGDS